MSGNPSTLKVGQNLTVYDIDDDRVLVVDDNGEKYTIDVPTDYPTVTFMVRAHEEWYYAIREDWIAMMVDMPVDAMHDYLHRYGTPAQITNSSEIDVIIRLEGDDEDEKKLREELKDMVNDA